MADMLFLSSLVEPIGWALVHFIWQGALIGVATAAALRVLAAARPTTRYAIAGAGLAAMLLAPLSSVWSGETTVYEPVTAVVAADPVPDDAIDNRFPTDSAGVTSSVGNGHPVTGNRLLTAVVFVWIAGVLVLSTRLARGYLGIARLTRNATRDVGAHVTDRVRELSRRLGLRRAVRVVESAAVAVPTLVGCLRPVVLLPASVMTGLPAAHLDAVITHELAHVRRHDYLVNALQVMVETLLFFHPAVWWCSQQIRIEREHCCDDIVVQACGDRLAYATALARLEELRQPRMALALAAADGSLVDRVRRLLAGSPAAASRVPAWLVVTGLTSIIAITLAGPTLSSSEREPVAAQRNVQVERTVERFFEAIAPWLNLFDLLGASQLPVPPAPPAPVAPAAPPATPAPPMPRQVVPVPPEPPEPPATPASPALVPLQAPPSPPAVPVAPVPRASLPRQVPPLPAPVAAPAPPAMPRQVWPVAPAPAAAPAVPVPAPRWASPLAPLPLPAPDLPAVVPLQVPEPPAPPAASSEIVRNSVWETNGARTLVSQNGLITVSDDDMDIVGLSPGGLFALVERPRRSSAAERRLELRGRRDGGIDRRFSVNGEDRPFDPEGRQWLREILPNLVRRLGLDAATRAERLDREREQTSSSERQARALESELAELQLAIAKMRQLVEQLSERTDRQAGPDLAKVREQIEALRREIDRLRAAAR